MTATEDRELRRALHGTLQPVPPPPVPLEAIVRRGKVIRRRRAGAAVGALALAAIVAVTSLALRASQPPAVPPAAPAITAGPDGVFASGTADGHPWRLAVQDIADPGYRACPRSSSTAPTPTRCTRPRETRPPWPWARPCPGWPSRSSSCPPTSAGSS